MLRCPHQHLNVFKAQLHGLEFVYGNKQQWGGAEGVLLSAIYCFVDMKAASYKKNTLISEEKQFQIPKKQIKTERERLSFIF